MHAQVAFNLALLMAAIILKIAKFLHQVRHSCNNHNLCISNGAGISVWWWHFLMLTLPLLIKSVVSDQYFCCIVIRDLVALSPVSPIQILSILLVLHHSCLVHWNHSSPSTTFASTKATHWLSGSSQTSQPELAGTPARQPIPSFSIHESHLYDFIPDPFYQTSPGTEGENWESGEETTSKVSKISAAFGLKFNATSLHYSTNWLQRSWVICLVILILEVALVYYANSSRPTVSSQLILSFPCTVLVRLDTLDITTWVHLIFLGCRGILEPFCGEWDEQGSRL